MDFTKGFSVFFGRQNWIVQLLLLGVCMLIPIIGAIVVMGYGLHCFVCWEKEREHPEFDFSRFGEYLKHGIWPFLVSLVIVFVIFVVMSVLSFLTTVIAGAADSGMIGGLMMLVQMGVSLLLTALMGTVTIPAFIRSGLMQGFAPGFSVDFLKDYLSKQGLSTLLAYIVLTIMIAVLTALGAILLCVGMYLGMALGMFVTWHVYHQLYRGYLAKGGQVIPIDGELEQAALSGSEKSEPPTPPAPPEDDIPPADDGPSGGDAGDAKV